MSLTQLLFSFEGRIGRGPFWLGTVLAWVYYALAFSSYIWLGGFDVGTLHTVAAAESQDPVREVIGLFVLFTSVAMIVWIDLALQVKRWHDRSKTGWWVLICLFPIVGLVWAILECGLFPGDAGPNRFDQTNEASNGGMAPAY